MKRKSCHFKAVTILYYFSLALSVEVQTGRWFSLGTPVYQTDCHDITEILLKVALNTINQTKPFSRVYIFFYLCSILILIGYPTSSKIDCWLVSRRITHIYIFKTIKQLFLSFWYIYIQWNSSKSSLFGTHFCVRLRQVFGLYRMN